MVLEAREPVGTDRQHDALTTRRGRRPHQALVGDHPAGERAAVRQLVVGQRVAVQVGQSPPPHVVGPRQDASGRLVGPHDPVCRVDHRDGVGRGARERLEEPQPLLGPLRRSGQGRGEPSLLGVAEREQQREDGAHQAEDLHEAGLEERVVDLREGAAAPRRRHQCDRAEAQAGDGCEQGTEAVGTPGGHDHDDEHRGQADAGGEDQHPSRCAQHGQDSQLEPGAAGVQGRGRTRLAGCGRRPRVVTEHDDRGGDDDDRGGVAHPPRQRYQRVPLPGVGRCGQPGDGSAGQGTDEGGHAEGPEAAGGVQGERGVVGWAGARGCPTKKPADQPDLAGVGAPEQQARAETDGRIRGRDQHGGGQRQRRHPGRQPGGGDQDPGGGDSGRGEEDGQPGAGQHGAHADHGQHDVRRGPEQQAAGLRPPQRRGGPSRAREHTLRGGPRRGLLEPEGHRSAAVDGTSAHPFIGAASPRPRSTAVRLPLSRPPETITGRHSRGRGYGGRVLAAGDSRDQPPTGPDHETSGGAD